MHIPFWFWHVNVKGAWYSSYWQFFIRNVVLISETTDAATIFDPKIIDSIPPNHKELKVEFNDKKTAWKSKNKTYTLTKGLPIIYVVSKLAIFDPLLVVFLLSKIGNGKANSMRSSISGTTLGFWFRGGY